MIKFSRLSMRWKLVLTSIVIEVAMLSMLLWNGLRLMDETLQQQAELRLQEVSTLLNTAIGPTMATQDYAPIADVFSQSRRADGIQYFVLTDTQGKALLADGWDIDVPPPPTAEHFEINAGMTRFDTIMPITLSGQVYGYLHFGISTQFVLDARKHLTRQNVSIAAFEVLISIALLAALAIWLTRHLTQLRQASEAVSEGRFGVMLNINSDDEIGLLAKTFNRMAEQIDGQLKALRDSEVRFRSLLNLSTDSYWEQDRQFRFVNNRGGPFGETAVSTTKWLVGKRRWELDTTLTQEQWNPHRAQLEAHETFRSLEYGLRFPDGQLRFLAVNGEPFFDQEGTFAGYRGTAIDITQRKLAESSLRLSASVFAEAHEGIIISDGSWRIIDINPMACEMSGYGRAEAMGSDLHAYFATDDEHGFNHEAIRLLSERGHWRGEAAGRRKHGGVFQELLTVSTVRNPAGEISNYIFMFSDISALKAQQAKLEALAHYDSLTQLPNRVLLADRMRQGIFQASRAKELLAVAYLDLDGFKPVNDTLGHDAGDQLLVEVAERLRTAVRRGDTVARLGGDEFALLLRAEDFGECEAALIRVLTMLGDEYLIKGQSVFISASIGVTLFPNDTSDPDVLLRHADQAMYVAKQAGRNRYHFFDAELDTELRSKHAQVTRIESALQKDEFILYYQPKVDMSAGKVTGAEALIRWQHPERGLLPPSEFLPLVENSEFAIPLGEWVITDALARMSAWQRDGLRLNISVNVSARQLQAPGFASRLRQLLGEHPTLDSSQLELEIVETAALDNLQQVSNVISECLSLGVSFALDDFGTGYSSLTYFKRLPARTIKIDRSFIRDMLIDPEDLAIAEGVIGLARTFQREVIAEGVETLAHGTRLMEMGCHYGQGYGIARPMPADELAAWIKIFEAAPPWSSHTN